VRDYYARWERTDESGDVTPNPAAADIFERNMERLATLAHQLNAALILSTPPSSIGVRYPAESTSPRGYWIKDGATTQRLRDELARRARSVAEREKSRGRDVTYLAHELSGDLFLDDAHLTARGNAQMASDFIAAAAGHIEEKLKAGLVASQGGRS